MSENTISKSQAKRQARREEIKKNKRLAARDKFIGTIVVLAFVGIFLAAIGTFIYNKLTQTTASDDFSRMLNEDGTVKNVEPLDYIEPVDYQNFVIDQAQVTFTEEAIDAEIETLLSQHQTAQTDAALTVQDGDTVNIDYVGTVDGVAFEGGDTLGNGADLTIGSGQYVDDFEQQLIGSHPGDNVTVNVTFPEDYTSTDLQGKDAVFEVTVNSIYVTPEFDDAFVAEHLAEYASTVEEYRTWLKETRERENLLVAVETLLQGSAVAISYNEEHISYLKSIGKYQQESYYESYNEMYFSMLGSYPYNSFEEFTGMGTSEFEDYLTEQSQTQSALDLSYQYIFTDAGLTITDEDYNAKVTELTTEIADSYGKPYVMQLIIRDKVIEYLADNANIQ